MHKEINCSVIFMLMVVIFYSQVTNAQSPVGAQTIQPLEITQVKINDGFWSARSAVWNTVTVYDVFDKLEGKYEPDRKDLIDEKAKWGRTRNAFLNFDRVAQGQQNTNQHDGPPWYDGLIYETIRGAAGLLMGHPDAVLEKKIDAYIDRIAAAQAVDPDGYINTYTTLTRPDKRWGTNGGDDKWQHDIYNAGMLVDAAVHYYEATRKTKLLTVAVKMSNYMCREMGPAPQKNRIPGHGGPEEAMVKLYWLFKNDPAVKQKISAPVHEQQYYSLAKFWIEQRGHYGTGAYTRQTDSSYNQDQMPVLEQTTIEGHAVRATLLATGVTAVALESHDPRYVQVADNYWNNMIGKRMFITGGEGALANGERFGEDYYLPESAYLETCAAIGAGFFSERMNELKADGKYTDELERILYNNMLSGVSLTGDHYFYENPLIAGNHPRWNWHDCPCCPPMFLKMVALLPTYIYATNNAAVFVNLFIGSEANLAIGKANRLNIIQKTGYPWKGTSLIEINPASPASFPVYIRIPGWAQGKENPFDLYHSSVQQKTTLLVNGQPIDVHPVKGYVIIERKWKKGDKIELELPVSPRLVYPDNAVATIRGKAAIAAGPIVYALEGNDNTDMTQVTFDPSAPLSMSYQAALLGGINTITTTAFNGENKSIQLKAIPFYAIGNRSSSPYQVWLPLKQ
jgi:DUF1680 family protein